MVERKAQRQERPLSPAPASPLRAANGECARWGKKAELESYQDLGQLIDFLWASVSSPLKRGITPNLPPSRGCTDHPKE